MVLGQAHAAQGDFDSAIARFQRALELKPDVPEANASLGVIYCKQGRPAEAEAALRAELAIAPERRAVPAEPRGGPRIATAAGRGARPAPERAREQARLSPTLATSSARSCSPRETRRERPPSSRRPPDSSPEDAYVHYQLGRAYQKLGRTELAEKELEVYRQIKDKRR